MISITNDPIPTHKFRQFHEILCANGGYYSSTPVVTGNTTRVDYYFDGDGDIARCNQFNRDWNRCTHPIKEVRKDQPLRKLFRRIFIYLKGFAT